MGILCQLLFRRYKEPFFYPTTVNSRVPVEIRCVCPPNVYRNNIIIITVILQWKNGVYTKKELLYE